MIDGRGQRPSARKPAVVAISSHVVRGSVGNRSAVFALERLGFPVWSVPTVILPYHPGHGRATRIEPPLEDFRKLLDDLLSSRWTGEVAGILSGYLANAEQAASVAEFVAAMKSLDPRILYLCDPVIGDENGLYVSDATATAMRDQLIGQADITAPNLHELAWLTGQKPSVTPEGAAEQAKRLGRPICVVTSTPAFMRGNIGNLLVDESGALMVEHRRIDGPSNGSGDLLSSLLLAHRLDGVTMEAALSRAAGSVFEIYARSAASQSSEIMPQTGSDSLVHPTATVTVRQLATRGNRSTAISTREIFVGVDGCRGGWVAVTKCAGQPPDVTVFPDFAQLIEALPHEALIAVDMPIGLPGRTGPGGRGPEQAVRPLIGQRQSSVFSVPSRAAIYTRDYASACEAALATSEPPRKVSRQAFGLFDKIREIDQIITPVLQARIREVHPELAFWRLNGDRPLDTPKKIRGRLHPSGMEERREILLRHGFADDFLRGKPPTGASQDDLLDACACLLIAERIAAGQAERFPAHAIRDERGLDVAIWA